MTTWFLLTEDAAPGDLIARTRGRIWARTVARDAVDGIAERHAVISTRLFAGSTIVHILADDDPGDGFRPAAGGLEDVYFSTLARTRRVSASAPVGAA